MIRDSTYSVARIEGTSAPLHMVASERECVLELTEARWCLAFRDSRRSLTGGLLVSRFAVEGSGGRTCLVSIADVSGDGFNGTVVVRAPAARVRRDLDRRYATLDRAAVLVAQVTAGAWWLDPRVFEGLDWSGRRSVAGVRYRAGWWGTGRLKSSMLPKILDFGPRGVVLRGWRVHLVIPWDAVESLRVLDGDRWVPDDSGVTPTLPRGTTLVISARGGLDAVFYSPLASPAELCEMVAPLVAHLPTREVITI